MIKINDLLWKFLNCFIGFILGIGIYHFLNPCKYRGPDSSKIRNQVYELSLLNGENKIYYQLTPYAVIGPLIFIRDKNNIKKNRKR